MKTTITLVLLFSASLLKARADVVVAPSDRATQNGNTSIGNALNGPGSFQTVYGSTTFTGPVIIRGLAFRVDEARAGLSFQVNIPRLTLQFTTYSGTLSLFDRNSYLANASADNTTVYDSSVQWSAVDLPGTAINPFDLVVSFSQPFVYKPALGALLVNFTTSGNFSSNLTIDGHDHGDSSIGWSAGAGPFGAVTFVNAVTEFQVTSIPEPSDCSLLGLGLVFLTCRKRA